MCRSEYKWDSMKVQTMELATVHMSVLMEYLKEQMMVYTLDLLMVCRTEKWREHKLVCRSVYWLDWLKVRKKESSSVLQMESMWV